MINECNDIFYFIKLGVIRLYFKRILFFGDISFLSCLMYVEIFIYIYVIFLIRDLKCFFFFLVECGGVLICFIGNVMLFGYVVGNYINNE